MAASRESVTRRETRERGAAVRCAEARCRRVGIDGTASVAGIEGRRDRLERPLRTELLRATRRAAPDQVIRARAVIDSLHLAAALEFGDELDGVVTYDARMMEAAQRLGISVVSP